MTTAGLAVGNALLGSADYRASGTRAPIGQGMAEVEQGLGGEQLVLLPELGPATE